MLPCDDDLTVEQAARLLQFGSRGVQRALREKRLRGYRLGDNGPWRIPRAALAEFCRPNVAPAEDGGGGEGGARKRRRRTTAGVYAELRAEGVLK